MKKITLTDTDRTVFSKCPSCCRTGKGMKAAQYFSMAYSPRQWAKGPKCDNCGTDMQFLYEVSTDDK